MNDLTLLIAAAMTAGACLGASAALFGVIWYNKRHSILSPKCHQN